MSSYIVNKVCIIGVGLIGGSIAKALKSKNFCKDIFGYSQDTQNLLQAQNLGIIDNYSTNLAIAIKNCDLVIIAIPIRSIYQLVKDLKQLISPKTIITDVSSVKTTIIKDFKNIFGKLPANFIPAHPLAGGEISGLQFTSQNLFVDKKVIITPHSNINEQSLKIVQKMWKVIGAKILQMNCQKHDRLISMTSHLPHLLAYTLMDYLISQDNEVFNYASSGFKDFSRIASSDATMWTDICLTNRVEILKQIKNYQQTLDKIYMLIEKSDTDSINKVFRQSKKIRDEWLKNYE